jgi:hypothetical protein
MSIYLLCYWLLLRLDYTIYHGDLEVVDPSGVKLHGLKNYKNAFMLIHAVINFFYCPERSLITFRLVYDQARNNIRVSWNAELVPKLIFGGVKTTLHVDGISVYVMEKTSGLITQHRVERLLINDAHVRPKSGIFYALTRAVTDMEGPPVLGVDGAPFHFEFRQNLLPIPSGKSLFDASDSIKGVQPLYAMSSTSDGGSDGSMAFDEEALEKKNISRKKRGLKALTPDEYMEFEAQTRQLELQQEQKANDIAIAAAAATALEGEKKKSNFLGKMMGNVFKDTCESNYDCARPQVCCDFKVKKVCCSSGMMVSNRLPRGAMAPVRVVAKAGYPPLDGRNGNIPY